MFGAHSYRFHDDAFLWRCNLSICIWHVKWCSKLVRAAVLLRYQALLGDTMIPVVTKEEDGQIIVQLKKDEQTAYAVVAFP